MEAGEDPSVVLVNVLQELDSTQPTAPYQDLCKALCARLDLPQLARLRAALLATACLDPSFPAALFQDKAKGARGHPHAKKIAVAADVVTICNLMQMHGGAAKDKPPGGPQEAREPPGGAGPFGRGYPAGSPSTGRPFVSTPQPRFLLGVSQEARARAASLDRLQALGPYAAAGPQPCEMQSTYFPMSPDDESISDHGSPPGTRATRDTFASGDRPFAVQPCVQKRNVFEEDLCNPRTVSPSRVGPAGKAEGERGAPQGRKEPPKTPFLNHSFETPYDSQYLRPVYPPAPDKRRAKHESLDDLQASTYFGPTPVTGTPEARRGAGRPGRQTPWPAKSWSLNAEEAPDVQGSFRRAPSEDRARYLQPSSPAPGYPAPDRCPACLSPPQQPVLPAGYAPRPGGLTPTELPSPVHLEGHAPAPKFKDAAGGRQLSSDTSSVGTQTEQLAPDPTAPQDVAGPGQGQYGARRVGKPSDDDSEVVSDDISDIFRFLDDMSVSGSTAGVPSSCYNSTGSLSQLPKSDGDSSPERSLAEAPRRPPGGQGARGRRPALGHPPEDALETSVGRLVLRVRDIERKLASLSGVREELSQVLGRLSQLDQRLRPPEPPGAPADLHSLTSEAPSDDSASPRALRPAHTGSSRDAGGSHGDSVHARALRKGLLAGPSSRSLTEDSATESKLASIANSPRDWRAVSYAGRGGLGGDSGDPGKDQDWPRKAKEVRWPTRPDPPSSLALWSLPPRPGAQREPPCVFSAGSPCPFRGGGWGTPPAPPFSPRPPRSGRRGALAPNSQGRGTDQGPPEVSRGPRRHGGGGQTERGPGRGGRCPRSPSGTSAETSG